MADVVKRGPGRPRKNPLPAPVQPPDATEPVETSAAEAIAIVAGALPSELANPDVARILDKAGMHEAASVIGRAISDPDQAFRDEVRHLCSFGTPVAFHCASVEDAMHKQAVVEAMECRPNCRWHTSRVDSRLEVCIRSAR